MRVGPAPRYLDSSRFCLAASSKDCWSSCIDVDCFNVCSGVILGDISASMPSAIDESHRLMVSVVIISFFMARLLFFIKKSISSECLTLILQDIIEKKQGLIGVFIGI